MFFYSTALSRPSFVPKGLAKNNFPKEDSQPAKS